MLRLTRRHPWLMTRAMATGRSSDLVKTPTRARQRFFSTGTTETDIARYVALLQEESQRVVWDALLFNVPLPKRVTTPLLVLGAEDDGCFTVKEVRALARAYHTDAEIFSGMGHDMMLEPGWAAVAERIHSWLGTHGL